MFPNEETKQIYKKYKMNRCYLYQNVTDTDSTSVFFIFIFDLSSSIREDEARDIIFEVMIQSKIFDRLDLSAELWKKINSGNKDLKKEVGYLKLKILIN